MGNRRMSLSGTGKEILDVLVETLEIERPQAVKIALAKGIAKASGPAEKSEKDGKKGWEIPDNIIKDKEYLLFKHLIINEAQRSLSEEELKQHMEAYIEFGLKTVKQELDTLSSIDDYRIKVLN